MMTRDKGRQGYNGINILGLNSSGVKHVLGSMSKMREIQFICDTQKCSFCHFSLVRTGGGG